MDNKKFSEMLDKMQEKIGKDASSKIADDIGLLITENSLANQEIEKRDTEITKLKSDKDQLQETNMSLLQQVRMTNDNFGSSKKEDNEPEKKVITYKDVFDENGNFKH
mgnify:CR=1 FL=1